MRGKKGRGIVGSARSMDDDGRAAISPCFSSQMRRWPCEFRESLSAYRPVHFQPPSLNLPFVPTLNENSVAIQSSSAMKVTIKEWNAVATWRWDMPDDEVCGICRVQFDGTCPTCKFPGDDCSLCMSTTVPTLFFSAAMVINRVFSQYWESVAIHFIWCDCGS